MSKLVVLSGVPGSGKSYFSNTIQKLMNAHVYVVSSDVLRKLISGNQLDLTNDDLVWDMFYDLAAVYSKDKKGVVILDATNFTTIRRVDSTQKLKPLFDEVDLVVFNIDRQIVSNQNLQRESPIPPEALERFFEVFEFPNDVDRKYFDKIVVVDNSDITKAVDMVQSNEPVISVFDKQDL